MTLSVEIKYIKADLKIRRIATVATTNILVPTFCFVLNRRELKGLNLEAANLWFNLLFPVFYFEVCVLMLHVLLPSTLSGIVSPVSRYPSRPCLFKPPLSLSVAQCFSMLIILQLFMDFYGSSALCEFTFYFKI